MAERIRLGNVYDHEDWGTVMPVHRTHENVLWVRRVKSRDNGGVINTGDAILTQPYRDFLGSVSMVDYPDNWDALARAIKQRDDHTCQGCGDRDADELHAHHIVPLDAGGSNARSNLITLCDECHGRVHGGVT